MRPPSMGKLSRRPFAVAGPTGDTLTPRSPSAPAVRALRCRFVRPASTGTTAAVADGAAAAAPARAAATIILRRRVLVVRDTRVLLRSVRAHVRGEVADRMRHPDHRLAPYPGVRCRPPTPFPPQA